MGRSIKAPYSVLIECKAPPGMKQFGFTPMSWFPKDRPSLHIKGLGEPNAVNLEKFVMDFAKSLKKGGANAHLSEEYIPYPTSAVVRENVKGGKVLATWKAPMFMVWP